MSLHYTRILVAGYAFAALLPALTYAQHSDIEFGVDGGKITLQPPGAVPVWTSFLLAPGFPPAAGPPPVQQDDPGFRAPSGSFLPGTLVGLNVIQPLWFWDGQMLATPPEGTVFELENAAFQLVTIDSLTVPVPPGFDFAVAGSEGGIHQHVTHRLPDPVSPDGAYGIVLELTAPDAEASDPFLIVFNQRLPNDQFELGVEAILDASGILQPEFLAGDYNADGVVEQGDLDLVLLNWGADGTGPPDGWKNDLPVGPIDQAELDGVLLNWGNRTSPRAAPAATPEPNAIVLLATAAWAAALLRRSLTR